MPRDLTPRECPHCLVNLTDGTVAILTSAPPKCGACHLPLWWEDRSGKLPEAPWPCAEELERVRLERADAKRMWHAARLEVERLSNKIKELERK